jgi:hypothetical protein
MTISRDGALEFLNKFVNNSSTVLVVVGTGAGSLCFECRILSVTPELVVVEQFPNSKILENRPVRSWISLDVITDFEYGDEREATPENRQLIASTFVDIAGVLTLRVGNLDAFLIVEYVDGWQEP